MRSCGCEYLHFITASSLPSATIFSKYSIAFGDPSVRGMPGFQPIDALRCADIRPALFRIVVGKRQVYDFRARDGQFTSAGLPRLAGSVISCGLSIIRISPTTRSST